MVNDSNGLNFSIGLDNDQLLRDTQEAQDLFVRLGQRAQEQGQKIDTSTRNTAQQVQEGLAMADAAINKNNEAVTRLAKAFDTLSDRQMRSAQNNDAKEYSNLQQVGVQLKAIIDKRQTLGVLLDAQREKLQGQAQALGEVTNATDETTDATVKFRTEYRNTLEVVRRLYMAGKEGTQEYRDAQDHLIQLTRVMRGASMQTQALASPTAGINALMSGFSGLTGAVGIVNGAMGLFASKNEDVQRVMMKLQSLMTISISLQQVEQMLYKNSAFRVKTLGDLKSWWNGVLAKANKIQEEETISTAANTAAKDINATSTVAATAATGAEATAQAAETTAAAAGTVANTGLAGSFRLIGAAIKSIPLFGWIIAGISALIAVISVIIKRNNEAVKAHKEFIKTIGESVAKPIASLEMLSREYIALGNNIQAQKKFIAEHKKQFDELGVSINNVREAENLLIKNKDRFILAEIAKAKAAAWINKSQDKLKDLMDLSDKIDSMPDKVKVTVTNRSTGGDSYDYYIDNAEKKKLLSKYKTKQAQYERDMNNAIVETHNADFNSQKGGFNKDNYAPGSQGYLENMLQQKTDELKRLTSKGQITKTKKEIISLQKQLAEFDIPTQSSLTSKEQKANRTQAEIADITHQIDVAKKQRINDEEQADLEIRAEKIDLENTSSQKVMDTIDLNYDKMIMQAKRKEEEMVKALQEQKKKEWEVQNPHAKDKGLSFDYNSVTNESLSGDQKNYLATLMQLADAYKVKATADLKEKEDQAMEEYLSKYGKYEERKLAITQLYDNKISNAETKGEKMSLTAERNKELQELEKKYGGVYSDIFADVKKKSYDALQASLAKAKKILADPNNGLAPDIVKDMQEQVTNIENELSTGFQNFDTNGQDVIKRLKEIQKLKKEINDPTKSKEQIDALKEQLARDKDDLRNNLIGLGVTTFISGLQKAASLMHEIADASGDIGLANTADVLDSLTQNLNAAWQGFVATKSGWGALAGGVTDIIGQLVESFEVWELSAIQFNDSLKDFRTQLSLLSVTLKKTDFESVFGTSKIAESTEAWKNAIAALKAYDELIARRVKRKDAHINNIGAWQDVNYLQDLSVRTRRAGKFAKLFGAEDKYKSLYDVAPEIWGNRKDGEFNVDAAKAFLATNKDISAELKRQLQLAIDLKEKYDDAMDTIQEELQSFLGNMASSMTDVIWDGVVSGGTDAFAKLKDVGNETIASWGKEFIKEFIMNNYLNSFSDKLKAAFGTDNPAASISSIVAEIVNGFPSIYDSAVAATQTFVNGMKEKGIDLSNTSSRSGATKGIASLSQTTGDSIDGKATDIQGKMHILTENSKLITKNTSDMLGHVVNIDNNTKRLEAVENGITSLNSKVDDIKLFGLKIK